MAVRIIVDSACDLTTEQAKEMNIEILPIKVRFGEDEFLDSIDLTHDMFFSKLVESEEMPTTSQISPYDYEQVFEKVKEEGDTAVCITMSSKLSGCYQSANIALDDYEGIIEVVDSLNVCVGERILTEYAVSLRDAGKSAPEIAEALNDKKKDIKLIALLDTLEYLKKGGRISAAAAIAGSMLSIKPVIAIENGEVAVLGKARGSKNGNNMLKDLVKREGPIDFSMPMCMAYSGLTDVLLQKYIKDSNELYEGQIEELPTSSIGCAIGTHIGPGAIAACFFTSN